MLGKSHMELKILLRVEENLTCKQLVEQTSQAPNIRERVCAYPLTSVVFVSVLASCDSQLQHLRRFYVLSASVPRLKFILICSEHMALPEVAHSDRECIKEVVF